MRRTYFIFLLPYYCPVVSVPKPRSSNSTLPWADRFLILTSSPSPPALVFVLLCGGFSSKVKIFQQYTAMGGPFSYLDFFPFPTHVIVCLVLRVCGWVFFFLGGGGGSSSKAKIFQQYTAMGGPFSYLDFVPFPTRVIVCRAVRVCVCLGGGGVQFQSQDLPTVHCHGRTVFLS